MGTPSSRRGRKRNDSCMVVVVVGGSLLAGVSYLLSQAAGWVL